jgi:hypothetical protein
MELCHVGVGVHSKIFVLDSPHIPTFLKQMGRTEGRETERKKNANVYKVSLCVSNYVDCPHIYHSI